MAKRGALFMTLLKREVQRLAIKYPISKRDSIKIPNATKYIDEFVVKFAKEFGYDFETKLILKSFVWSIMPFM